MLRREAQTTRRILCALLLLLLLGCALARPLRATRSAAFTQTNPSEPLLWSARQSGTMTGLRSIYFLDDKKGWIVGGAGLVLTTGDGGATWQTKRRPNDDTLWDVQFTDENMGWILAERSIYKLRDKEEQRSYLLQTSDGGATWARVDITDLDPDTLVTRIVFPTNDVGYVFGETGTIFTTRDAGFSWARLRVLAPRLLVGGYFFDADNGWVVGAGGTLLRTADGGETWKTPNAVPAAARNARFNAVTFPDAKRGWAVGSGGQILMTVDGGGTWRAQSEPSGEDLFDVRFISATEGWAAGSAGTIIHTTDGGLHWSLEKTNTKHPLARLSFSHAARGWAVGFGGTILQRASAASTQK